MSQKVTKKFLKMLNIYKIRRSSFLTRDTGGGLWRFILSYQYFPLAAGYYALITYFYLLLTQRPGLYYKPEPLRHSFI